MALDFEGLNNCQELYIIGFISNLSKDHFFKEISYRMLLAKFQLI